mmetsp:Transcript_53138/g.53538  ORF Transcript_53138/g.53538 Transcript_53138/m.53538 type:complete len:107 (+) Transcript_53138:404-724(+)
MVHWNATIFRLGMRGGECERSSRGVRSTCRNQAGRVVACGRAHGGCGNGPRWGSRLFCLGVVSGGRRICVHDEVHQGCDFFGIFNELLVEGAGAEFGQVEGIRVVV